MQDGMCWLYRRREWVCSDGWTAGDIRVFAAKQQIPEHYSLDITTSEFDNIYRSW